MNKQHKISVDELAAFMNDGWPGEEWYLHVQHEYLWETTFTTGESGALYRARRPGTVVALADYEGRVRWQGSGPDPTERRGDKFTELFLRWQRTRSDAVVTAYVPRHKLAAVTSSLKNAGCLVVNSGAPAAPPRQRLRRCPDLDQGNRPLPHSTTCDADGPLGSTDYPPYRIDQT